MIKGVPIAHLHGGELTLGVIDERIRHSITKMSDYHFTSLQLTEIELYRWEKIKKKVFHIGSLALERIKILNWIVKVILKKK